jgi:N6-L-threonylcarbamoyladenine synthase
LKHPVILAIESSCDDTSAAVISGGNVLSNLIANQSIHEKYGGVVPEVASRAHMEYIMPVVKEALEKAGVELNQVDAIACTAGPGLVGSLMVGVTFAKTLAFALRLPLISVHHMQAHVLAHFIDDPKPDLPFLCLTVSGGHTQIIKVTSPLDMKVLGTTRDDAAGEAFDKSGKLLGLPYPAGPHIDKLAKLGQPVFSFPEPLIENYDFSFSGLKTSILYFLQGQLKINPDFISTHLNDLCASIQKSIVDILLNKLSGAAVDTGIKHISIAGGVSANSELRQRFEHMGKEKGWKTYIPQFQYCTDNAGMIAMAAHFKYLKSEFAEDDITPDAKMPWF